MENLIEQAEFMVWILDTNATLAEIEEKLTELMFDQAHNEYVNNQ